MVDWQRHLEVKHNPNGGQCIEKDDCPNQGMVYTLAGDIRLADDPQRQWTEQEIDSGAPWKECEWN